MKISPSNIVSFTAVIGIALMVNTILNRQHEADCVRYVAWYESCQYAAQCNVTSAQITRSTQCSTRHSLARDVRLRIAYANTPDGEQHLFGQP